jgi:hypothetical protein
MMPLFGSRKVLWQFLYGLEQERRTFRAQAAFCGKRTENADGAHIRAAGHLDILWRITNIDAVFRRKAGEIESMSERRRMRLATRGVFRTNAHSEMACKLQIFQLDTDAVAAAACHQTQYESLCELAQNSAGSRHKPWRFSSIGSAPDAICFVPTGAVKARCAIDVIPIGMIVARKVLCREFNSKCFKHRKIRALICPKRIEQSAIPIEEHSLHSKNRSLHATMLTEKTHSVAARLRQIRHAKNGAFGALKWAWIALKCQKWRIWHLNF